VLELSDRRTEPAAVIGNSDTEVSLAKTSPRRSRNRKSTKTAPVENIYDNDAPLPLNTSSDNVV